MPCWWEYQRNGEYVSYEDGMDLEGLELVECYAKELPDGAFSYKGFIRRDLKKYEGWSQPKAEKIKPHGIISDNIEIFSHADKKMYDSRSEYYRSLKDKGMVIVESGMNTEKNTGLDDKKFDKAFKQALEQHGY